MPRFSTPALTPALTPSLTPSRARPSRQRGAAALVVVLMLLGALLLVLVAANRDTLLELRQAANQARSTQAFEAAEAGLEWATALLDTEQPIGPDCRPAPTATDSFRTRHLDTLTASFVPRRWSSAGNSGPLQPACVHTPTGWACACPGDAAADVSAAAADPDAAGAFLLSFDTGPRPGVVRVTSIGCSRLAGDCRPGSGTRAEATARSEILLALQPALLNPPAAALTLRDPLVSSDSFFAAHFGLSKALWKRQGVVQPLACRGDCGAALSAATASGSTLLAVDGELVLQGPLTLGTPQRPLLIVADGAIRLQGAVTLHGVLYGSSIGWSAPAAVVRGALLSEGAATGDTSLDLVRDADVLAALQTRFGSLVRLPGSWRDF